jgi:hypothetical protein
VPGRAPPLDPPEVVAEPRLTAVPVLVEPAGRGRAWPLLDPEETPEDPLEPLDPLEAEPDELPELDDPPGLGRACSSKDAGASAAGRAVSSPTASCPEGTSPRAADSAARAGAASPTDTSAASAK